MNSATRYQARAPRYVFRPDEQRLMRFKPMEAAGHSTPAQIRNISQSGISFVVAGDAAPFPGEMLKVEFALPGRRRGGGRSPGEPAGQVAWFADVTRVESRVEWDGHGLERNVIIVALRFRPLPSELRHVIERSLKGLPFPEQAPDFQIAFASGKDLAVFTGLALGTVFALAMMSIPPHTLLAPFRALF